MLHRQVDVGGDFGERLVHGRPPLPLQGQEEGEEQLASPHLVPPLRRRRLGGAAPLRHPIGGAQVRRVHARVHERGPGVLRPRLLHRLPRHNDRPDSLLFPAQARPGLERACKGKVDAEERLHVSGRSAADRSLLLHELRLRLLRVQADSVRAQAREQVPLAHPQAPVEQGRLDCPRGHLRRPPARPVPVQAPIGES